MANRVYCSGVKATAVAYIKSDLAGFISSNADGVKVVDKAGLENYLNTQFAMISTDAQYVAPATAASSAAAARAAPTGTMAGLFDQYIGATHWSSRSDWPTTGEVLGGSTLVSAISQAIAECAALAAAVSNYYSDIASVLYQKVCDYYDAQKIDSSVPAGVVRLVDTRFYVQTFVSDKGEESAPSPVSAILRPDQNDTVTIGRVAAPGARTEITYYRIYRSNSGNTGDAFQYVPNPGDTNGWPIATSSFTDGNDPTQLQGTCRTLGWAEPPADAQGVVAGPNGGGALYSGNKWCPWVNFYPYAYREQDKKSTQHPIVGQGIAGDLYVVLTRGIPYFMQGTDASAMASIPRPDGKPCVAPRGIVSMGGSAGRPWGVVYPAADGLYFADANGFVNLTGPREGGGFDLFTKEDWQAITPSGIFAAENDGCYVFYCAGGCFSLNVKTGKLTKLSITASAFFRDGLTETLYYQTGTVIWSAMTGAARRTAVWESMNIMMSSHPSFQRLRVRSDFTSNGAPASVTVKYYGNDVLIYTATVSSRVPVPVPAGRFDRIKVHIESAARITDVALSSSIQALQQQ